jgi:hypothetical protein
MVTNDKLEEDMTLSRIRYAEYLKGKRVAIIGPAPSILNSKQKTKLESYDVIVRLNKAVPVPYDLVDDIGKRTDVLYNCMNPCQECGGFIDIDLLHKQGVKFLVAPYTHYKEYRFGQDNLNFAERNLKSKAPIFFCHIDNTLFARLMEIMKLPNTGVNAIIDLLYHDIKELYITGLTFFKGGYVKQYRGYSEKQVLARMAKHNLHDQDKQLAYMKKLLRNNPRVVMDQALSEIIYENTVPLSIDSSLIGKHPTSGLVVMDLSDLSQDQKDEVINSISTGKFLSGDDPRKNTSNFLSGDDPRKNTSNFLSGSDPRKNTSNFLSGSDPRKNTGTGIGTQVKLPENTTLLATTPIKHSINNNTKPDKESLDPKEGQKQGPEELKAMKAPISLKRPIVKDPQSIPKSKVILAKNDPKKVPNNVVKKVPNNVVKKVAKKVAKKVVKKVVKKVANNVGTKRAMAHRAI